MVNLLRNGIEAMDQQPTREITIDIKADAGCVTVSVRDHGPGLSEEVLAHLFEPFFTTKPTGKGLGLGLSLSLAIVREMGGTIQASNAAPGARFDITLPQAKHEPL
jgi:two-component system, NtrC family, C4-dicarboxylate transport sensor histidine kinase DctB